MKKLNVMVVFGGQSGEHEVSLMSAASVLKVMNREKYNIIPVGITKDGIWKHYDGPIDKIPTGEWESLGKNQEFISLSKNNVHSIDLVFPILHGPFGEDGTIQGLLEMVGIPYVGAGVLASAVAMDKAMTKKLCIAENIPQAQYITVLHSSYIKKQAEYVQEIEEKLGYPVFVKPANLGSSVGISKAKTSQELREAMKKAFEYDRKIVVEAFIDGREIECSVLGNDEATASLPAEIIPSHEFYDYKDKYFDGTSRFQIPADLPETVVKEVQQLALKVYKLMDCSGLARVDFFVERQKNQVYFNEINTMPGFTKISMYPKMWEATGLSYEALIDKLIALAVERFKGRPQRY
ncbi:D-alanine--D-alanine ligase [Clostridium formicaceticum]|uniref:D-alanine--D-alanine ligase n=2 Tax=Clostridium formicaceticum TaxID=1497 RepID=A0AAC9RQK7_9CLOT|nr:D-alanine--D-alanine ligase family protein [Clostridium formicaceticum]AOY75176.1 D-alanine--D-alanine ligase A [Clostridium formicaceticum]ARE89602.1 D-alanine--D-alanine ligase [Clostridium formicaceticum]